LLAKPDWLFLDEATSATDEAEEAALYRTLAEALPATTLISIGHRGSLEASHQRVIMIDRAGRPGRLIDRGTDVSGRYGLVRQGGALMKNT
jgi:putative ATP-binding cassette transporter